MELGSGKARAGAGMEGPGPALAGGSARTGCLGSDGIRRLFWEREASWHPMGTPRSLASAASTASNPHCGSWHRTPQILLGSCRVSGSHGYVMPGSRQPPCVPCRATGICGSPRPVPVSPSLARRCRLPACPPRLLEVCGGQHRTRTIFYQHDFLLWHRRRERGRRWGEPGGDTNVRLQHPHSHGCIPRASSRLP